MRMDPTKVNDAIMKHNSNSAMGANTKEFHFPISKFARGANTINGENNIFKMASLTLEGPICSRRFVFPLSASLIRSAKVTITNGS